MCSSNSKNTENNLQNKIARQGQYLAAILGTVLSLQPAHADLQNQYNSQENDGRASRERCIREMKKGNYTQPGGGSWQPEYYVNGNSIYERRQNGSCDYDWRFLADVDQQRDWIEPDQNRGFCKRSVLFKRVGSDLQKYFNSNCFIDQTNGIQRTCYVPIDWERNERRYPHCGCFDSPVENWLKSSNYCRRAL
jgi:hypothetical protein